MSTYYYGDMLYFFCSIFGYCITMATCYIFSVLLLAIVCIFIDHKYSMKGTYLETKINIHLQSSLYNEVDTHEK